MPPYPMKVSHAGYRSGGFDTLVTRPLEVTAKNRTRSMSPSSLRNVTIFHGDAHGTLGQRVLSIITDEGQANRG